MPADVVGEQPETYTVEEKDICILLTQSEYKVLAETLLESEGLMVPMAHVPIWGRIMDAFENPSHPDDLMIDGEGKDASGSEG